MKNHPPLLPFTTQTIPHTIMNFSTDEYESVGERGAYRNAVLADEAERDRVSSPRVTTIIPSSPVHIATPPPVIIPSADMIREAPDASFMTMLESLASTATRVEMVEESINYHCKEEVVEDDDPGLPYFPNNPASLRFYPLYIPRNDQTDEKVVAPYIYYRNHSQEVVGCMKRDAPPYAAPVYIHTPNPVQLPIPLTNTQISQFACDDPRAYAIDEVLWRLEDPRIDTEVSRLREKLRLQEQIQHQLDDIRRQERQLVGAQFDVEQTIDAIRDRMERACLYQTLADAYARMVVRPSPSPSDRPLGLRARGPLEMPQLHDEPRRRGCWECGSTSHRRKQCPERRRPPRQCTYCQSYSHRSPQCLFKRLAIPPPRQRMVTEALAHETHTPTWCGKCLRTNPGHDEVDCPMRELCRNCGKRGNLYFLRTHRCDDTHEQLMHGEEEEGDPELYGDGES